MSGLKGRLIRYIEEVDDPWQLLKMGRNLEMSTYILEVIEISEKRILDVGGGFGFYSEFLRTLDKQVVCCDISRRMVNRGKKMFPELEFVICDGCHLPFKSESFDGVLCMGTLIYVEEKEKNNFIYEINFVLKEMGKLCFIERNKSSPWHFFLRYTGIFKSPIGEYDNFLTMHKLKNLLLIPKDGFETISITGDYFIIPFGMKYSFIKKICKEIARLIPAFSYLLIVNARKRKL